MKKLRYTVGQDVRIKEYSVFAETFNAGGLMAQIVESERDDEEFDYKILIEGDSFPLLVLDNELV